MSSMAGSSHSFVPFGSTDDYEKETMIKRKGDNLFGMDYWREFNPCRPEDGIYQQQKPESDSMMFDEFQFSTGFKPILQVEESIQKEGSKLIELDKQVSSPSPLASPELLSNYGSGLKRLRGGKLSSTNGGAGRHKLSTEDIIRVAGTKYIQFYNHRDGNLILPVHPFGSALSGLSEEETKDVELAVLLLDAAEKVQYQQFDHARKLLTLCESTASDRINPVQRIVFCFAEALLGRIDKETSRSNLKEVDEIGQALSTNPTFLACHKQIPFSQVMQFTGIQAIIETLGSASKIHLIDLQIRSGVQWIVLMQSLAEPNGASTIEHLKITAVASTAKYKVEEMGERLITFAKSMNLPLSFKIVFVSDMKDIKEDMFEIEEDETVAIYSLLILRTMITKPKCLENLMAVIRNLNPSILITIEVEANLNSPSFVNRFIEALFFYSAYFDCLETCMYRNNRYKSITEAILRDGIENIVAMEGNERNIRSVKIDVWRVFFARFGMMEIGFSESSLYQARLVVKQFTCGNSCTLEKNGKCLIVGWKGTPIHSISAMKFAKRERE